MKPQGERMIVIDGVDGAGKGEQSRRLERAFADAGLPVLLTREPGGSPSAEEIRELLVSGDPDKWDDMTELLLMYAARRAHLRDTVWPALAMGHWVISDRFADSSRAFQGIAGDLGLDTVERIHELAVGGFEPGLVLILDLPETLALERTRSRGGSEDRFEKKGVDYHARVRAAFRQIASGDSATYRLIDASRSIERVATDVLAEVNRHFGLSLLAGTAS